MISDTTNATRLHRRRAWRCGLPANCPQQIIPVAGFEDLLVPVSIGRIAYQSQSSTRVLRFVLGKANPTLGM